MENIILTNNKDLRLVSVKVGVLSTLRFELPLVSESATHVEVIVTSGNVHSAYTATFIDSTKRWQCDIAASQFPAVGKQSYEVAYVLDGKQFWDGKGWIEIENATTSGIEPQPRPEPYRYAVVSVNGYGADAQGAVRIPKTFIAANSPATTEGYMEGDIYFNRETGATWTLCNVQGTLTWVFNYKNYYTKAETDEAIDRVAAYYITYDAAGNPFPTYASLANAQTVYSGGAVRVPTRNDYCVVLADETHQGAEYRYIYAVAEGATTGSWQPQFPVGGVMTVDQTVTKNSANPVTSGGIWSAIWGALAALPTGFSSLYDWCVSQLAGKLNTSSAAPAFTAKIYAANDLCTYNGVIYSCKVGYTATASSTKPDADTTHWEVKPASDLFLPLTGGTVVGQVGSKNTNDANAIVVFLGSDIIHRANYNGELSPLFRIKWPIGNGTLALTAGTGHTGNLAALDANGNPTDSGKKPSDFQSALTSQQLANIAAVSDALAFDATHTYAAGDPVVYNGVLYTFTAAHTGAWTGSDVSAVDIIAGLAGKLDKSGGTMTGPLEMGEQSLEFGDGRYRIVKFGDGLAILDLDVVTATKIPFSPTGEGTLALTANIPYDLVTKTIDNGAVTLDDRASNAVEISETLSPNTLTINFPTATSGKVRDFAMRLNIAAGVTAPEIAWPQGVTLENNGGEVPEIADGGTGGSSTILYFSETENNGTTAKFLVKGETLTAIAQA